MTDEMTALTPSESAGSVDDWHWANMEIARAKRQIERGIDELAEGIVALSLILDDVRRRRLYRFDPQYPTFEAFVEHRHGIAPSTARMYVDALTSLGEANYRRLLVDLGFQRTHALALLHRTDPSLVTGFLALPDAERKAITTNDIVAIDRMAQQTLQQRVRQLEQEILRERGLVKAAQDRLRDVERLHQRVEDELINERDEYKYALEKEQRETERLRELLRQARASGTGAASLPSIAPTVVMPTPTVPPVSNGRQPSASGVESVVVTITIDIEGIIADLYALEAKARQLQHLEPEEVPAARLRALASAVQNAVETLQTVATTLEAYMVRL